MGRFGTTVLFGLPGKPVALILTFLLLLRPALRKMMEDGVMGAFGA